MRVALTCSVVLVACGFELRGPKFPDPPLVEPGKYGLQRHTAAQKISTLKMRSALAANTAQAAAAQASTQKIKVEEVYMKTMAVMPELQTIKKDAKSQAAAATESMKEGVSTLKIMEKTMKNMVEDSKLLAVQKVKSMLQKKYHTLSDWRHNVLTNPYAKGQVAAAKAAVPYFKTMGSIAASGAAFGIEASSMRSQAAADAANAKSLQAGVQAKRDAGDVVAAEQDREMAKALDTQSKQLAARANMLDAQVSDMRKSIPEYAKAAQMASWSAQFAANPDSIPPPPIDPNFAYSPPDKLKNPYGSPEKL